MMIENHVLLASIAVILVVVVVVGYLLRRDHKNPNRLLLRQRQEWHHQRKASRVSGRVTLAIDKKPTGHCQMVANRGKEWQNPEID